MEAVYLVLATTRWRRGVHAGHTVSEWQGPDLNEHRLQAAAFSGRHWTPLWREDPRRQGCAYKAQHSPLHVSTRKGGHCAKAHRRGESARSVVTSEGKERVGHGGLGDRSQERRAWLVRSLFLMNLLSEGIEQENARWPRLFPLFSSSSQGPAVGFPVRGLCSQHALHLPIFTSCEAAPGSRASRTRMGELSPRHKEASGVLLSVGRG